MKKIISFTFLLLIPLALISQVKDAVVISGAKYRIFPGQDDPLQEFEFWSRTFLPKGTPVESYDNTSDVVKQIVDNARYDIPNLPVKGKIEQGKLYQWNDRVVRARQSHDRTVQDPIKTPDLFIIYRKKAGDMTWIQGEKIDVGTIRVINGKKYVCIQAHISVLSWEPNKTPALWKEYDPKEQEEIIKTTK